MQKLLIALICILIIIFGITSCTNNKIKPNKKTPLQQTNIQKNKKTIQLTGVEGIKYSIKQLPETTVTYLKTKSEFKELYTDKKFAIYYVGADCPYAQLFINTINPLKEDPSYSEKYNFYPQSVLGMEQFKTMEDAQASIDFSNTCQEFCIVNPATNEIFTIDGIGEKEAAKLPNIMEQLKNW